MSFSTGVTDVENPATLRFVHRYIRTWSDFIFLRPKRFYKRRRRVGPDAYVPSGAFVGINATLYGLAILALIRLDAANEVAPEQVVALFGTVVTLGNLLFLPIGALAARLLRKRFSMRRAVDAYCFASATALFYPITMFFWFVTGDAHAESVPWTATITYWLVFICYQVGATARFNHLDLRSYFGANLACAVIIGLVIVCGVGITYFSLPENWRPAEIQESATLAEARETLATLEPAQASMNADFRDFTYIRVWKGAATPTSPSLWRRELNDVAPGDVVSLAIYYHNCSVALDRTARNVRIAFSAIRLVDGQLIAMARISGDNVAPTYSWVIIRSAAGLYSDQPTWLATEWFPDQQHAHRQLPYSQTGLEINGPGVRLGDIAPGWTHQGYVVVRIAFRATGVTSAATGRAASSALR